MTVHVSDALPATETRVLFTQPGLEIRAGGDEGGVRLVWTVAPAVAILAGQAPEVTVVLSHAAVRNFELCLRSFLETVLIFLLRRAGWHHVHAATALDPSGQGWLIAGNGYAGKSTTTALLASQGWGVGGDDVTFLAEARGQVVARALRAPIALRSGALALFDLPQPREDGAKASYWPEELGSRWVPSVEPSVVLFTSVGHDCTEIAPLPARDVAADLVRWSAWVMLEPNLAQQHLDLLVRLARQARGYRVRLGPDLFQRPERLQELVA
jgi:hypothetical protein